MKKRFVFVGISVLLAVTLLTAFCAYAKPPFKATLLGIYTGETGSTYKALKIVPINNMIFGVYSDTAVQVSTNLRLYFGFGVNSISSFSLSLKKLTAWAQDASTSLTGSGINVDLINYNSNGTVTGYTSIKTTVQTNRDTSGDNTVYSWTWSNSTALSYSGLMITIPFQSFILQTSPLYFEMLGLSINGDEAALSYTDQKLDEMLNYESEGGSSDTEGASELVEDIAGDVSNINSTINSHKPNVSNWLSTSLVASDLVNIALLANSWLPAYLSCDPDVYFYWSLVTFCIVLCLIENGLRRRPWHGFDDGGDFESEYDVTSTDENGRSRTIHNKVVGSRRRRR